MMVFLVVSVFVVWVAYKIGLPILLQWLAKENILVTTVREGTVKAIMKGDSLDHFIMSFNGYHLNQPGEEWYYTGLKKDGKVTKDVADIVEKLPDWQVVYHGKGNRKDFSEHEDACYDRRSKLLKKLGLYWVGLPWIYSVYVYGFEWSETQTTKDGDEKLFPRAEATDFIYVADFIYAIKTAGAETKDRLPTDELTLVTVAVRNPYLALFGGEDWMRRVVAATNRHVRTFVGSRNYQELISPDEKKVGKMEEVEPESRDIEKHWKKFSKPLVDLTDKLPDDDESSKRPSGLKGRYGVEIRTADLQTMELSGDGKALNQAAATKRYVAEQEAAEITLTGQAKADVVEKMGEKEAIALRARLAVIKENGKAGELLAQLDAMQEASKGAGNTVIWANSPFVAVAEALSEVVKKKGGEKK